MLVVEVRVRILEEGPASLNLATQQDACNIIWCCRDKVEPAQSVCFNVGCLCSNT